MPVAIIDIGTNTVLMLIAERGTPIQIIRDEHAIARLGEGVDTTHRIGEAAYERFAEIMRRYSSLIREYHVERVVAFATSAMRDATNRDEIIARTSDEFGISIELLSGAEEARWSFRGALFGIESANASGNIATIDIGGGSTEISFGSDGTYLHGASADIGAVRLKERYLSSINDTSVRAAREAIAHALAPLIEGSGSIDKFIAVAGTPTSLAAMKHRLQTFDETIVNTTILDQEELGSLVDELLSLSPKALKSLYPVVSPARADILPAGALILQEAMNMLGVNAVRVSTKGVRYGVLLREIENGVRN